MSHCFRRQADRHTVSLPRDRVLRVCHPSPVGIPPTLTTDWLRSGKTVDEVWKAIHTASNTGPASAAPGGMPPSYESLPLGTLLESLGVMSVEGLGFPLNSVPSYLPPASQQPGCRRSSRSASRP